MSDNFSIGTSQPKNSPPKRRSSQKGNKPALVEPNPGSGIKFNEGEIFDDLVVRFILNAPEEEYENTHRLFFQIEQANWFYCDFYCVRAKKAGQVLPNYNFKDFAEKIFEQCPPLAPMKDAIHELTSQFYDYKGSVPSYGAIILNEALDKVLLIRAYRSKNTWGFPKGKINKDESELQAAVREVKEEIGYDISSKADEHNFVEVLHLDRTKLKLFFVTGVPDNTVFNTQTRKEIREIAWHNIRDILKTDGSPQKTNKYWMVTPAMKQVAEKLKQLKHHQSIPQQQPVVFYSSSPRPSFQFNFSDLAQAVSSSTLAPQEPAPLPSLAPSTSTTSIPLPFSQPSVSPVALPASPQKQQEDTNSRSKPIRIPNNSRQNQQRRSPDNSYQQPQQKKRSEKSFSKSLGNTHEQLENTRRPPKSKPAIVANLQEVPTYKILKNPTMKSGFEDSMMSKSFSSFSFNTDEIITSAMG